MAQAVGQGARSLGITTKAGPHTGECDAVGDRLSGVIVRLAVQVAVKAAPGEALVSTTVKDLVAGSGIQFDDRGVHRLAGIDGQWHLFAVKRRAIRALSKKWPEIE